MPLVAAVSDRGWSGADGPAEEIEQRHGEEIPSSAPGSRHRSDDLIENVWNQMI